MSLEHIYVPNESIKAIHAKPNEVLLAAILCNNAKISGNEVTGDPTEVALLRGAKSIMGDTGWERVDEIAFSPERKMMSTVNRKEKIIMMYAKGAPEVILTKCAHV